MTAPDTKRGERFLFGKHPARSDVGRQAASCDANQTSVHEPNKKNPKTPRTAGAESEWRSDTIKDERTNKVWLKRSLTVIDEEGEGRSGVPTDDVCAVCTAETNFLF